MSRGIRVTLRARLSGLPGPLAVETAGMECDKGAARDGPIQHQVADFQVSKACGREVLLPRLMTFVLACALLLLPLVGIVPHLDAGDWHGQYARIDAGNPVLALSNHDAGQAALRNAEARHSGKMAGGCGKATFAFVSLLPEPVPGRPVYRTADDAGVSQLRFFAFSARAPPRQV